MAEELLSTSTMSNVLISTRTTVEEGAKHKNKSNEAAKHMHNGK